MRNCILFSLSNTVNLSNYCHAAVTVQLCPTLCKPMDIACQAPLSMGFSRQEYWSGLPFLPPGDLPGPGIEPKSPALADGFFTTKPTGKPLPGSVNLLLEALTPAIPGGSQNWGMLCFHLGNLFSW